MKSGNEHQKVAGVFLLMSVVRLNPNQLTANPRPVLDTGPMGKHQSLRWTPHPEIMAMTDNEDYILRSSYIPIRPLLQGGGSSFFIP